MPAPGYVLAHHLAGRVLGVQGAWAFVRGGMGAVSGAIAAAARQYGAKIFAEARVERILDVRRSRHRRYAGRRSRNRRASGRIQRAPAHDVSRFAG